MDVKKLSAFFKSVRPHLESWSQKRNAQIGFNAFALASHRFYLEDFHSDVLCAILDPRGAHGRGKVFLELFRDFLVDLARKKGKSELVEGEGSLAALKIDESVEVVREWEVDGRIDIAIRGRDWVIIIENKINDACDQERQIPRYIEGVRRKGYKVKAVVYLTAAMETTPARVGWKAKDPRLVGKYLLPVVGFSGDPDALDLSRAWLAKCEGAAGDPNTRSVLAQYRELLHNQAGEIMSEKDIREVIVALVKSGLNYLELRKVLESIPSFIIEKIRVRCKDGESGIDWKDYYRETASPGKSACVLGFKKIKLAIEVFCGSDQDWYIT